ncbi:MAG: hypothetical protein MUF11_10325 [Beijerinckiaceae bacterium]|jgi:hypothetical protein|nr:hypothetical protein [Beijerinckiaceae bacterium]
MRNLRKAALMAALFSGASLAELNAASRPAAIDIDPSSPTLGEMLDREAAAMRRAREEQRAREAAERAARTPEITGSIASKRIVQEPALPRGAVTVILPHPKLSAGRPVSLKPERR